MKILADDTNKNYTKLLELLFGNSAQLWLRGKQAFMKEKKHDDESICHLNLCTGCSCNAGNEYAKCQHSSSSDPASVPSCLQSQDEVELIKCHSSLDCSKGKCTTTSSPDELYLQHLLHTHDNKMCDHCSATDNQGTVNQLNSLLAYGNMDRSKAGKRKRGRPRKELSVNVPGNSNKLEDANTCRMDSAPRRSTRDKRKPSYLENCIMEKDLVQVTEKLPSATLAADVDSLSLAVMDSAIEDTMDNITVYLCADCGDMFVIYMEYMVHCATRHKNSAYPCVYKQCMKRFTNKEKLTEHVLAHDLTSAYRCDICCEEFEALDLYLLHVNSNHLVFSHSCHNCKQSFNFESARDTHAKNCGKNKSFGCNICGRFFSSAQSLLFHKEVHCLAKPYTCKLCSKSYTFHAALRFHVKNIHKKSKRNHMRLTKQEKMQLVKDSEKERSKFCDQCGRQFSTYYVMLRHRATHGVPEYHCKICNRSFYQKDKHKHHMKVFHEGVQYKCDYKGCDKVYKNKTSLRHHQCEHNKQFRYHCNICSKGYNSKFVLNEHINTHTKTRPHCCNICNKRFRFLSSLSYHAKSCMRAVGQYQCTICHKRYKTKSFLALHEQHHKDPKKFSCNQCSKSYPYLASLKQHQRLHAQDHQNQCKHCRKPFPCRSALLRHHCTDNDAHNISDMLLARNRDALTNVDTSLNAVGKQDGVTVVNIESVASADEQPSTITLCIADASHDNITGRTLTANNMPNIQTVALPNYANVASETVVGSDSVLYIAVDSVNADAQSPTVVDNSTSYERTVVSDSSNTQGRISPMVQPANCNATLEDHKANSQIETNNVSTVQLCADGTDRPSLQLVTIEDSGLNLISSKPTQEP